ncbi:hypothetical protein WJX72_005597 [[Myrmecia] bisecta]|uniref:Peptidase A2 domain-containing protein n=1 Tax=[Myrmecia] bisecta TaxID=41462 RepID=A0AAW1QF39_9CHLO
MRNVERALKLDFREQVELVCMGHGKHMGTHVAWQLRGRPDGAFWEQLRGPHLSCSFGHDGGVNSSCWQVDYSGVPSRLELDDREAQLMATWPSASTQLTADVGASTSASNHVTLALCLSGGKMVSHLRICTATWRPLQLQQPLAGDWETWSYEGWAQWQPRLHFPACTQHLAVSAGGNCYNTDSVQLAARYSLAPYSMPAVALRPPGTHYDPRLPSAVPAWWTVSGHVVVEPVINGRTVGFMILDTGASNCVIERSAADQLGLDAFGSLFVSGMAGKVDSVYRTAATLQLGPLTMKRPLFFEMPLGGLVRGEPGRIIGIVGADVFRRATVELPQPPSHAPGNYRPQPYAVHLHDPETYRAPAAAEAAWQPVLMVSNLPHVYVRMQVADAAQQTKALLLLDSGAGGMDIIFSPRATALLNVPNAATQNLRVIKGVGGSEVNGKQSGRAASTTLDWVQAHVSLLAVLALLLGGFAGPLHSPPHAHQQLLLMASDGQNVVPGRGLAREVDAAVVMFWT